jgi:hypothetical protein
MNAYDFDLEITKTTGQRQVGGVWVTGLVNERYRFDALVFAEHAESEDFELERSRISKLWIRDKHARKTAFNFDRGLDIPATDTDTQAVVEFLCEGLADLIHG